MAARSRPEAGRERMLETCASVEDAIAFYRQASAILGAEGGKLLVERSRQSRGFGFCGPKLGRILAKPPIPTVSNGAAIMRACLQQGETPTRYSNVYDLKSGEIFLFGNPRRDSSVKLNLPAELAKGGHMQRLLLGRVQPIPDQEPKITKQLRGIIQAAAARGALDAGDYTA